MSYLQSLLHALAWTDILPGAFVITIVAAGVGRCLTRRKATSQSCRRIPTVVCDGRRYLICNILVTVAALPSV